MRRIRNRVIAATFAVFAIFAVAVLLPVPCPNMQALIVSAEASQNTDGLLPQILDIDESACLAQYQGLLDTYTLAEKEHWDAQLYGDHGLSRMCGAYGLITGYCFADINLDGIPEMLVGIPGIYGGNLRYGYFYGIHTLVNGKPKLLLERGEFSQLFLCSDGTVGIHGYTGDSSETWELYTLPNNGDLLVLYERLGWDTRLYQDRDVWFRNNQLPSNTALNVLITKEEAMKVVDSYPILNPEFKRIVEEEETHDAFYGVWCLGTKDENEAWSYADWLSSQGYAADVYLTTDWANLNAEPWYVVSAGEYGSENDAYAALQVVQQVCGDAYVKWSGEYKGG